MAAGFSEDAAATRASGYGIEVYGGVGTALNHPGASILVNLACPAAQVKVATAAGEFDVEVPAHASAPVQFASGTSAQGICSVESARARLVFVEITGPDGTTAVCEAGPAF